MGPRPHGPSLRSGPRRPLARSAVADRGARSVARGEARRSPQRKEDVPDGAAGVAVGRPAARAVRPGPSGAGPRGEANRLYRYFVGRLREAGLRVEEGVFRAMMDVSLVNRGPVTILLDSAKTF